MTSKITQQTNTSVTLLINLDEKALAPIVASTFDTMRSRVKASGFRPGKAPNMIVERELGSATVQSEILDAALQASYSMAVSEHKLAIIASPQVSIDKFVPYTELEYKAVVDILPPVQLPEYKKLKKKRPEVDVNKADIDRVIEDLQKRAADRKAVERAAKIGDEVVFDFDGTKNGQPVSGASAKKQTLSLGSKSFIPGFEEEIVGLTTGEEKSFDITFAKDYSEPSLAGEKVTFKIKLHTVHELTLPTLDKEFIEKVSPYSTVQDLRADIEKHLREDRAEHIAKQFENEILEELLSKTKYSAPASLITQQIARLKTELEQNLASNGLDIAKYLALSGKAEAELDTELTPEAEKRVGLAMMMSELAKVEEVSVGAAEIDAEIDRLKGEYQDPAILAELAKPAIREDVYNHLVSSKTIEKLLKVIEQ